MKPHQKPNTCKAVGSMEDKWPKKRRLGKMNWSVLDKNPLCGVLTKSNGNVSKREGKVEKTLVNVGTENT